MITRGINPVWNIYPREYPAVAGVSTAVAKAVRDPIGSPLLERLVRPGCTVAIAVDDLTRPTPQREVLPVVLDELNRLGVSKTQITLIIGLGVHRPMNEDEIRARFGESVVHRVAAIINHDPRDEFCTVVGRTGTGEPISVNTRFVKADLKIAVGCILPHVYAGWSGGAKMVQPGISSQRTTAHVHRMANIHLPTILGTVDNIVRQEMEQIARAAGLQFIVNVVLNSRNEVAAVVAGDPVAAHRAGVRIAEQIYTWIDLEPANIVVATAPACATDLWQSAKSMAVGVRGMKQGGTLILVAPCPEGVSPGHHAITQLGAASFDDVLAMVDAGAVDDVVGALVHMTISRCRERGEIVLVSSGVSAREAHALGLGHADSVETALEAALLRHGPKAKVGVIKDAGELTISIKGGPN